MKKILGIAGGAVLTNILGHGTWIAALVNFAWLLFKDTTLFSWWWILVAGITFIVVLITTLLSAFSMKD